MPTLPKKITIDYRWPACEESPGPFVIDGEAFPWYVSAEHPINVELSDGDGLKFVTLTIPADAIQVIPADPESDD